MAIKIKTDTAPDERKKSAASRKDVNRSERPVGAVTPEVAGTGSSPVVTDLASAQASPADTPSRTFRTRAPNNTFDRKAYMAAYMRQYNAKKKAKKQNDVD